MLMSSLLPSEYFPQECESATVLLPFTGQACLGRHDNGNNLFRRVDVRSSVNDFSLPFQHKCVGEL